MKEDTPAFRLEQDTNDSQHQIFTNLSRRSFLRLTGLTAGGLIIGWSADGAYASNSDTAAFSPNVFLNITKDGSVVIFAKVPEIGQGVKTSLPMIVAEELDVDWNDVKVKQAPINTKVYGRQTAGNSMSISSAWDELRRAGAIARSLLVKAAANQWGVDETDCLTKDSIVSHPASKRTLGYGELASTASKLPIPAVDHVRLKSQDQYRLLGKRVSGVDNREIVTGASLFGVDQNQEGLVYAVYQKCPAIGGKVVSANLDEIKQRPGVLDAFIINRRVTFDRLLRGAAILKPGVAIIARSTWEAFAAKRELRVEWDESEASKDSWTDATERASQLADQPGESLIAESGDVDETLQGAEKTLNAFYSYPYLAHAQLEPQNCTAYYKDGNIELWAPTQNPPWSIPMVSKSSGIPLKNITVRQLRVGGAFGRRLVSDFMCEATEIAKRVSSPVKLMWTREDDMSDDYYRAGGFHWFSGAMNEAGKLVAWKDHFITFSNDGKKPVIGGWIKPDEFPAPLVENFRLTQTMLQSKTPAAWWRAPGSNGVAFAVQSFIHELAVVAGRDHLEFLLEILAGAQASDAQNPNSLNTARAAKVIKMAAEKAGWGKHLPKGRGLGLAFHFCHQGHFAEVAEVSVDKNKKLTVHKITVAGDVGQIVNLSGAENQCEGAVVDGLSAMMDQGLSIEDGRIQESNFHKYALLRMPQTPEIDVHFVHSDYRPTGLGEPALPPVAPAVCNAIFAAIGKRIRHLPLTKNGIKV